MLKYDDTEEDKRKKNLLPLSLEKLIEEFHRLQTAQENLKDHKKDLTHSNEFLIGLVSKMDDCNQ